MESYSLHRNVGLNDSRKVLCHMNTNTILHGKRVATLTLGCKVNQYETEGMRELLEAAGCQFVAFEEEADIYLVNTCSVTNIAERKSRQMLHKAKKRNPEAIVVAAGCYVQTVPQEVIDDLAVDLVIGNNHKKEIVEILDNYYKSEDRACECWNPTEEHTEYENMRVTHRTERVRAYVKIQDGCNQFCSYCIIPYVRGRIRSRQIPDVVTEVETLAEEGCKEIVLTGIHISSYGKDWDEASLHSSDLDGTQLIALIDRLCRIEGIARIRLGSLEPRIMTTSFMEALASYPKVCPHFHLSLQSACNETLRRMNRKYTIEEYKECCDRLRQVYDRPAITTDVIVGFPGETEEEFTETVKNLEALQLYEIHVFKYSSRRGTVAEKLDGQVSPEEKNRRSDILLALTARQKQAFEESFVGEEVEVLIEEENESDNPSEEKGLSYVGHTERYIRIEIPERTFEPGDWVNCIVKVKYYSG